MAIECFLKLEGPEVKGESAITGFEGQFELTGWSWGASQSGSMQSGSGGGTGKANVQDIEFNKWVDKGTPNLWQFCINGTQFEKATLTCRKAGGGEPVSYLKIEMEDVILSSISTRAGSSDDRFSEHFSLNFGQYKMTYTPQKDDGTADSDVGPAGWNMRQNAKV
jgi:type VI secretion system secreted protein Hcp